MYGVLRLIVTLDGEDVIDCEPILGYLHRGMEKIGENQIIIQFLSYLTHWEYFSYYVHISSKCRLTRTLRKYSST